MRRRPETMDADKGGHALITGACGALGRSLADQLCRHGFRLSLCDIDKHGMERLTTRADLQSRIVLSEPVDVCDEVAIVDFIRRADAQHSLTDCYVVAGITEVLPEQPYQIHKRVHEVNYHGAVATIIAAAARMRSHGGGRIVVVSSLAAIAGFPRVPQYAASKAAIGTFVQSIAPRFKADNISLTLACPGFFDSSMSHSDRPRPGAMTCDYVAARLVDGAMRGKDNLAFPRWQYYLLAAVHLAPSAVRNWFFRKIMPH